MSGNTPQSMGGKARAIKLSVEERRRIAVAGARAKWDQAANLPEADYPGVLQLGASAIPCAVLSDGRRVLSENGITNALLGSRSGASKRLKQASVASGASLPLFIAPGRNSSHL